MASTDDGLKENIDFCRTVRCIAGLEMQQIFLLPRINASTIIRSVEKALLFTSQTHVYLAFPPLKPPTYYLGNRIVSSKVQSSVASNPEMNKVNINTDSIKQLCSVHLIDKKRANMIISRRPFKDIKNVNEKTSIPKNFYFSKQAYISHNFPYFATIDLNDYNTE